MLKDSASLFFLAYLSLVRMPDTMMLDLSPTILGRLVQRGQMR